MSRTAIVFGGGGFIGTNLCRRLVAQGHLVRAFGRRRLFPAALDGVDWIEGDLADADAVASALHEGAVVYHLIHSVLPHAAGPEAEDTKRIIGPTFALLGACHAAKVARVVFVSSGGTIYGAAKTIPTPEDAPLAPITPYAVSNMMIERALWLEHARDGLEFRALRVTNPYGPFQTANNKQGVIAALIARALRGEEIEIWGDGSVVRDFVYIDDVADALIMAADDIGSERIVNIGSGQGRSLREVIAAVELALGQPLKVVFRPGRPTDVPVSVVAIDRAREALGWTPKVDFASGLRQTIAWWQQTC